MSYFSIFNLGVFTVFAVVMLAALFYPEPYKLERERFSVRRLAATVAAVVYGTYLFLVGLACALNDLARTLDNL